MDEGCFLSVMNLASYFSQINPFSPVHPTPLFSMGVHGFKYEIIKRHSM
jgi:hypothetical protein